MSEWVGGWEGGREGDFIHFFWEATDPAPTVIHLVIFPVLLKSTISPRIHD